MLRANPRITLYGPDGFHPSRLGDVSRRRHDRRRGITGKPAVGMARLGVLGASRGDPAARGSGGAAGSVTAWPREFPIVLSNGPPPGSKAWNGRNGLAEVAAAGVTHCAPAAPTGASRRSTRSLRSSARCSTRRVRTGCARGSGSATPRTCRRERAAVAAGAAARADRGRRPGPSGARRLQGDRRAAQSVPRRELDPPGRDDPRLQAAEADRPGAPGRRHAGADRDRRRS